MSPPSPASRVDRIVDGAILIMVAALPIVMTFAHRGVAPAVLIASLAIGLRADVWRRGWSALLAWRDAKRPLAVPFAAFVTFCLWAAASALWSPSADAFSNAFGVLGVGLCGGALASEALRRPPEWINRHAARLALSIGLAAAALCFESLSGGALRAIIPPTDESPGRYYDVTALGRGVTTLSPLAFVAAALLLEGVQRRTIAAAIILAALVAAGQLTIAANLVALVVGAALFLAALRAPRAMIIATTGFSLALLFLSPALSLLAPPAAAIEAGAIDAPASWLQRLVIWREGGAKALFECAPFGCGANFAREWASEAPTIQLPGVAESLSRMPTHPHNVFIEIWLELGLPGVAALAIAIFSGGRILARYVVSPTTAAALCGATGALLVSFSVEASLWQEWRLAAPALVAFGVALSYRRRGNGQSVRRPCV